MIQNHLINIFGIFDEYNRLHEFGSHAIYNIRVHVVSEWTISRLRLEPKYLIMNSYFGPNYKWLINSLLIILFTSDFSIFLWLAADYFTLPQGRRFFTIWEEPALRIECLFYRFFSLALIFGIREMNGLSSGFRSIFNIFSYTTKMLKHCNCYVRAWIFHIFLA